MKRNFGHFLEIFTQYFFFHAHFFLRLIIEFYEKICQFFAFFWIFTHIIWFSRIKNHFFSRNGTDFSRRKKKTLVTLIKLYAPVKQRLFLFFWNMEYSTEYSMEYSMEYENQQNGIFQKNWTTTSTSIFLEYGIFQ